MDTTNVLHRATLSEQVATQIAQRISAGMFKAGEKLPSEPQLCRVFGVGRSTVREALKSLAYCGMVETHHGEGTFAMKDKFKLLHRPFVHDIWEARMALESETAALCAQRATDDDLRNLENLVREMSLCADDDEDRRRQLDLQFHVAIAASCKNEVLARLMQSTVDLVLDVTGKIWWLSRQGQSVTYMHHQRIVEALKERNARKARSAMRSHLRGFMQEYKVLLRLTSSDSTGQKNMQTVATQFTS